MSLPPFEPSKQRFPDGRELFSSQWQDTFDLLHGAEMAGIMDAPYRPLSKKKGFSRQAELLESVPDVDSMNPIRFQTIHEQLFLLGYLDKKQSKLTQTSRRFKQAVRQFQEDAGLIKDGWTGNQTWQALTELISFESRTDVNNWQSSDGFLPAFHRAARLRLWAYGLANEPPATEFKAVSGMAISRLKKALWCVRLLDDYEASVSQIELYSLLFDSEGLVEATVNCARQKSGSDPGLTFRDSRLELAQHRKLKALKRRFITNLAKTELWLLGSEIKIDGKDDYPVSGLPDPKTYRKDRHGRMKAKVVKDSQVHKHLEHYWLEYLDGDDALADDQAKRLAPDFFSSLLNPEQFSRNNQGVFEESDYSQELANYFEKNNTHKLIDEAYAVIKRLGMRLWDGLKRLWRWIKGGVRKVVTVARNLQRAFFRFALKGYKIVRTAFTALARSLEQYLDRLVDLGEIEAAAVLIARDMDLQSYLHTNAGPDIASAIGKAVRRFGAMFLFSFHLIAMFVNALKSMVLGVAGWYRLSLVLVKSYRDLAPAYRRMMAVLEH